MLSSWLTGVKQRAKPGNATASPTVDSNEEYYGYGSNSPNDGAGDKDYRNRGGDSADKVQFCEFIHCLECCLKGALSFK